MVVGIVSFRDGKDLAVTLEGVTNGHFADTDHCIYFLHFINIVSGSLSGAMGREIRVTEVDLTDEGAAVLRILHRDSRSHDLEDEIVFSDFDFYMKDSRCP